MFFLPANLQTNSSNTSANLTFYKSIRIPIRVDRYQTQSGENKTFTKVSARNVQALDSNRGKSENPYVESHQDGQPSFEPTQGLDPNGFQAIDDEDIPF